MSECFDITYYVLQIEHARLVRQYCDKADSCLAKEDYRTVSNCIILCVVSPTTHMLLALKDVSLKGICLQKCLL